MACAAPLACGHLFGMDEPPLSCSAARGFSEIGKASWYGPDFDGLTTASGETFDMTGYTAAHRRLPFGTRILVTNLDNNRSVELVVNDRGPFVPGRVVDVSRRAAEVLEFTTEGLAPVRIKAIKTC